VNGREREKRRRRERDEERKQEQEKIHPGLLASTLRLWLEWERGPS